jgi:hypothetical protein
VGLAAALIYLSGSSEAPDWHILLGFAASGYAGTDFIEGFISKYLIPTVQPTAKIAAIAPRAMPAPTPSTPKQLVYSVILQLEPYEQLTDDTSLADLAFDDAESKDTLCWAINRRHWHGVVLNDGDLDHCTKVSDVTKVVAGKVKPPAKPAPPSPPTS